MSLRDYIDKNYPGYDTLDFNEIQIGQWNMHAIFPDLKQFIPDIYQSILEGENCMYLPLHE